MGGVDTTANEGGHGGERGVAVELGGGPGGGGGGGDEYVESEDFGGVAPYMPEVLREEQEREVLLQRQAEVRLMSTRSLHFLVHTSQV